MSTVQSQVEKKFEIHVKEHPGELLQHIAGAWKERRLCDFLIKVGSKEIPVHKIILSEGSDYFKAMLSHKMKEVESGVAVMKGVDPECMLICIEYIYTGKVSVPESKVHPLLQVASMLQLTRLCEVIAAFLETNLDPDSFFLTHKISNAFNLQGLKDHCEKYAIENFKSIAVKEGFKDLEKEFVKFLIESKETKASEADKCKTLLFWANSYLENRSAAFEDCYQTLQLQKIPTSYRLYLSEKEPLVSESAKCLRTIVKSLVGVRNTTLKDHALNGDRQQNAFAVFDKISKSIQAFNPEDKTWKQLHDLTDNIVNKAFFSATVIDENIFIVLDDNTNYKLNYTDSDAKWIQLPSRTMAGRALAVPLLGEVYAFHDLNNNSQTIEKLNTERTSWSQMNKPFPCYVASVIAANGHIYTFGGLSINILNKAAKFDPSTKAWSDLPPMPTARYGAGATELNGKIYVMGGFTGSYITTTECFDVEFNTWTTLKSMSYQHYNFNPCTLNGKIYAVGGYNSQNSVEEYDPDTNSWKSVDMMAGKTIHDQATITLSV